MRKKLTKRLNESLIAETIANRFQYLNTYCPKRVAQICKWIKRIIHLLFWSIKNFKDIFVGPSAMGSLILVIFWHLFAPKRLQAKLWCHKAWFVYQCNKYNQALCHSHIVCRLLQYKQPSKSYETKADYDRRRTNRWQRIANGDGVLRISIHRIYIVCTLHPWSEVNAEV